MAPNPRQLLGRSRADVPYLLVLMLGFVLPPSLGYFSEMTGSLLGQDRSGVIAAFGDFNADKHIDVFVVNQEGRNLKLLIASENGDPYSSKDLLTFKPENKTVISNVVPADFNGDIQMDILICRQTTGQLNGPVVVEIYWGKGNDIGNNPDVIAELKDQPLVMDANGDMIPDLFGEAVDNGKRYFWISSKSRNFTKTRVKNGTSSIPLLPLMRPHSSAFVDLNNDLTADLFVLSEDNGQFQMEHWLNQKGKLVWSKTVQVPSSVHLIGQASFIDIDADSDLDVVLPVCEDSACKKSSIYTYSKNKWHHLTVGFDELKLKFPSGQHHVKTITTPISLRAGDYNLDGYPDFLSILSNQNQSQHVYLLENVPCNSAGCHFSRTYKIRQQAAFNDLSHNALLSAFFDVNENGILDVLITTNDTDPQIHIFQNKFIEDACFLKVMVVSGLCDNQCPSEPYGVNQPGPVIKFETTKSTGDIQLGFASQLTQSQHFALQLPFTVFGLGQTPNYVDKLTVGIPHPVHQLPRSREWTSIIPNSQLIIIPYPNDSPASWKNKLFVTASHLVLLTGATLLGTCGFISIIVGLLHWRDRVEDKKEKLQEAHRFHFDAM